jgi:outer membrane protein assembly factor BamB
MVRFPLNSVSYSTLPLVVCGSQEIHHYIQTAAPILREVMGTFTRRELVKRVGTGGAAVTLVSSGGSAAENVSSASSTGERTAVESITTETRDSDSRDARDPASGGVPMYLYDAANTGVTSAVGPKTPPETVLTTTVEGGLFAPPAVGERLCYLTTADGRLLAIERDTGEIAWEHQSEDRLLTTPALDTERLYLANENRAVRAFDRDTGAQRWSVPYGLRGGGSTAPVLANDLLYAGSMDGYVRAFDTETGITHWEANLPGAVVTSVAVDGGYLYAAVDDSIYAVDAGRSSEHDDWVDSDSSDTATGDSAGSSDSADSSDSAGGDDHSSGARSALPEPVTRSHEWRTRVGARIRSSIAVRDGRVVVGTDDGLAVIDSRGGGTEWRQFRGSAVEASPAVTDERIYAATVHGDVVAYDARAGYEKWRSRFLVRIDTAPVLADGLLYVVTGDGRLTVLDPTDGSREWYLDRTHTMPTTPHVVDGTVYVADWDGTLSAHGAPVQSRGTD